MALSTILIGFFGEVVYPVGSIELMVIVEDYPQQTTVRSIFLVIDALSAYNTILERPMFNCLGAVVSTHHLRFKFPTIEGTGVIVGN